MRPGEKGGVNIGTVDFEAQFSSFRLKIPDQNTTEVTFRISSWNRLKDQGHELCKSRYVPLSYVLWWIEY